MIELIPDGYTDCAAAINRAIELLSPRGGEIVLPPGDILLREPINIKTGQVSLLGSGREITRLIIDNTKGCAIAIEGHNTQVSRVSVRNLSINSRCSLDVGAGIKIAYGYDVRIKNCLIANLNFGVECLDSSFIYITDCEIVDPRSLGGGGILVHGNGIHNDHYFSRVFVQCRKQVVACEVGIRISNSQGFWLDQCGIFHCNVGLHLLASNGQTLEHGFLSNNAIDTCVQHGILINASDSGVVRRVQSTSDWVASNEGHGVLLDAGTGSIDDIKLLGARLYGNGGNGLLMVDVGMISVDNSNVAGNGRNGISSGITVQGSCDSLMVRNCTIGAFSGYSNTQAYGIAGIEYSARALITGNAFEGNRKGALSSRPLQAVIENNLNDI